MAERASESEYMDMRRVGEIAVTVINDGEIALPLAAVFPPAQAAWLRVHGVADACDAGLFNQFVTHVRAGEAAIVIDPAFDDPGTAWDRAFAGAWLGVARTPGMAAGLATIGVRPEDVTHVIITHAHSDHFAGIVVERDGQETIRFPNARHLIGRAEWEGNAKRDDPATDVARRLGMVADAGLLDLVDGDRTVAPGVTMLHMPGETPGHSIVRIEEGGARLYVLGDLFHHASEIAHLDWISPWVDPATMARSRQRFLAEAVPARATMIFTHGPFPPWGRILPDGDAYRWQLEED